MEARSLADLNRLAANPPQYPSNPTQESRDPLTLYISRVPGTRDIILSPFKPGLKNVTAEDVATSLYYVHLEMPSADLPAPSPIRDETPGRSSSESTPSMTIRRKPLPRDARPVTPDSMRSSIQSSIHPLPLESYQDESGNLLPPPYEDHLRQRPRAATTGTDSPYAVNSMPQFSDQYLSPDHSSRPAGPRPMSAAGARPPTPDLEAPAPPLPPRPRNPPLPPRPSMQAPSLGSEITLVSPASSNRPRRSSSMSTMTPFVLTLIRRDPGSGAQWNVGRITSQQLDNQLRESGSFPAQPASRLQSSARPTIDIRMEGSGYAKFRNMPARKSMDARPASSCGARIMPPNEEISKTDEGMFARQVVMSYGKSFTANMRHKFQQGGWAKRHRNDSVVSFDSVDTTATQDTEQGLEGLKPRGYVFMDPWNGTCEFRTGNGGRSLRCHQTQFENTSYNPLVTNESEGAKSAPSSVVSELRFNLPSADLFTTHDKDTSERRGHFNKLFRQDGGSDDSLEDDENEPVSPFDVNLGRERAGGGNRGTRAKLGKLIIHDGGTKMLDLVVSANIGVWWGAWERSF